MFFCEREGGLYWMYCTRTRAEKDKKDAFSVFSDKKWEPYKR